VSRCCRLRNSGLVLTLSMVLLGSPGGMSPTAIAGSDGRIVVDRSIDPDGYILDRASLGSASELPPACVSGDDEHPQVGLARVRIRNDCPASQRVKVHIAFWFDSSCFIVSSNGNREYEYANSARFDGLTAC
jgi:hypothetical protein